MSHHNPTIALSATLSARKLNVALVFGAVLIFVLVLQVLPLPEDTRLWKEILNAGHVLLFGVLAIFFLWTSTKLFSDKLRKRYQHYLTALVTAIAIGALTEILQRWTLRDASLADFARNIAGTVCFLGFYSARDSGLEGRWKNRTAGNVGGAASAAILLAALAPMLGWTAAYAHRSYTFPEIVSFGSYFSRMFLRPQYAELVVTDPPQDWTAVHSTRVGRLTLKLAKYPGLWVEEPYPDWSNYHFLRLDIYSEVRSPIRFAIRIHDWQHNNEYADRFNYSFVVQPGANRLGIPIDSIRTAPAGREMDLRHIAAVALFAIRPTQPYTIDIDGMWLE